MGKRLIDADALIAEYDRVHIGPAGGARKLMEDAPTVDAVEVVRCKDCEYYGTDGCVMDTYMVDVTEECFCSYGERKEKR